MKLVHVIAVAFIVNENMVQSLQVINDRVGEHDIGYSPQRSLQIPDFVNYTLGYANCVFNFTDIKSADEVVCTQDIDAPPESEIIGELTGGNCTDMTISAPDILNVTSSKSSDIRAVSVIQFSEFPVPEVQGDTSVLIEFCLTTTVGTGGVATFGDHRMHYIKTPISVEFQYDGSVSITTAVRNTALGEYEELNINFQPAEAFVCNPDFTPNNSILEIGDILYVCAKPEGDQLTTVLDDVNFFHLKKAGFPTYKAIDNYETNPVTVVTGKRTRRLILGCRLPSFFFETNATTFGSGEVILQQGSRLLRYNIDVPRDLQEEANPDSNIPFNLDIKVKTYDSSSDSVLSRKPLKSIMTIFAIILGAFHSFDKLI